MVAHYFLPPHRCDDRSPSRGPGPDHHYRRDQDAHRERHHCADRRRHEPFRRYTGGPGRRRAVPPVMWVTCRWSSSTVAASASRQHVHPSVAECAGPNTRGDQVSAEKLPGLQGCIKLLSCGNALNQVEAELEVPLATSCRDTHQEGRHQTQGHSWPSAPAIVSARPIMRSSRPGATTNPNRGVQREAPFGRRINHERWDSGAGLTCCDDATQRAEALLLEWPDRVGLRRRHGSQGARSLQGDDDIEHVLASETTAEDRTH
jgi:hypothetical protein